MYAQINTSLELLIQKKKLQALEILNSLIWIFYAFYFPIVGYQPIKFPGIGIHLNYQYKRLTTMSKEYWYTSLLFTYISFSFVELQVLIPKTRKGA
jgi:hypothetical protein